MMKVAFFTIESLTSGSRFLKLFTHAPTKACLSILKAANNDVNNNDFYGPRIFEISGFPKKVKYNKIKPQVDLEKIVA